MPCVKSVKINRKKCQFLVFLINNQNKYLLSYFNKYSICLPKDYYTIENAVVHSFRNYLFLWRLPKGKKKKMITLEICGDGAKLNQPTLVTSSKSIRHPSSSQDGQQRLSGQCHNATWILSYIHVWSFISHSCFQMHL